MGFPLLLLVLAVLFLRPAELMPGLEDQPIYEILILSCLACSGATVLRQLEPRDLGRRPITACILGLLVAVVLSHFSHFLFSQAARDGFAVFKVVLLYLLLVGNVSSFHRLRWLLGWLGGLIFLLAVLAL